jgi:hypothetical protein
VVITQSRLTRAAAPLTGQEIAAEAGPQRPLAGSPASMPEAARIGARAASAKQ